MKEIINSQLGVAHLFLLVAVVGVVLFILISTNFSFKNNIFQALFPKPPSHAASNPISDPVFSGTATLALSPTQASLNKGCIYQMAINLDTGNSMTDGTDAILKFDPNVFQVVSVTPGSIYIDYPGNVIDNKGGQVIISGLSGIDISTAFKGGGTLATVNFLVKSNTNAFSSNIRFDFDPNNLFKTTDSNVVEQGSVTDVLASVTDGSYNLTTGTCPGVALPTTPGEYYLSISDFIFNPTNVLIPAGSTIHWYNDSSSVSHTITSNQGYFISGTIPPGQSYSYALNIPGDYPYYCSFHPNMTGQITITPGARLGDINGNSKIDIFDLSILLSNYSRKRIDPNFYPKADLNNPPDGVINVFDLSVLLSRYGT